MTTHSCPFSVSVKTNLSDHYMCEHTYIIRYNLLTNVMTIHWQGLHYKQATSLASTVQADIQVTTHSLLPPY